MRFRRIGKLKEDTKALIESLDEEIDKKEKILDSLKAEKKMLQRKLEEED